MTFFEQLEADMREAGACVLDELDLCHTAGSIRDGHKRGGESRHYEVATAMLAVLRAKSEKWQEVEVEELHEPDPGLHYLRMADDYSFGLSGGRRQTIVIPRDPEPERVEVDREKLERLVQMAKDQSRLTVDVHKLVDMGKLAKEIEQEVL